MFSFDLFKTQLEGKSIFLFSSSQINSPDPHFFICLGEKGGRVLTFVCCTTQFEKRKRFIEQKGLPHQTLVWIKPDAENQLSKDTYIDCNKSFDFTLEELNMKYQKGEIRFIGQIIDTQFEQILLGIDASPLIEGEVKIFTGEILKKLFG